MAVDIEIRDESTRRVIHQAIWDHAQGVADGGKFSSVLTERLFEHSWTLIDARLGVPPADCDPSEDLFRQLDVLDAIRAAGEQLRTVEIGGTVELPLDQEALVYSLKTGLSTIEDDEEFWHQPEDVRLRLMAARDTFVRLLTDLGCATDQWREFRHVPVLGEAVAS